MRDLTYGFSSGLGWIAAAQLRRHKPHKLPAEASVLGLRVFGSCCAWKEPPTAGQCLTLPLTTAAWSHREGRYHRKRLLLEHSHVLGGKITINNY